MTDMDNDRDVAICGAACQIAAEMPLPTLQIVARIIAASPGPEAAKLQVAQALPQPHYRDLAMAYLVTWRLANPQASPQMVAMVLRTAGQVEQVHRQNQSVELAWTGPASQAAPFRRTEQAILQVLDSAQQRITVVSYAVYCIPNIAQALVKAAGRGVQIRVIIETPDRIAGLNEYSTLQALGPAVAACSQVYYWPPENRPSSQTGHAGILHVKCVVADGRWLFLSSANLTEYAFTVNMELGVLITGGPLPHQVESHFERLMDLGVLAML